MLFFLLSGFLMGHLYANEEFNFSNVKKYALARVGRVFPLYFLLLTVSICITKFADANFIYNFEETSKIVRAIMFIDAPYVFWTIPVEVQFYVIFVGFWFLYKKRTSPYLIGLYGLFTMAPSVFLYSLRGEAPAIVSSYSYAFFAGVVTALLYKDLRNNLMVGRLSSYSVLTIVLLFVNLPALREEFDLVYSDTFYLKTWGDPITWLIVYSVFVFSVLNSKGLGFLSSRPFVFLGNISFGFYLIHYPVLIYCKSLRLSPSLQFVLAFLSTSVIAHLSYKYFERYVNKWIKGLGSRPIRDSDSR